MTTEMPTAYDAGETEDRWYAFWEAEGFFRASDDPADTRPTYTIAIPPPNVTGSLHMGHACRTTFEDVLIRYERMNGKNALWIPGTDHAGIATQVVVERKLRAQGISPRDLGREEFVKKVWEWKTESGGRILEQLRKMGASCDWSRERFTMDEGLGKAVRECFVRLHEEGLIYRGARLINWCVSCKTALSDLEVVTQENVNGELFDFAYPLEDGTGEMVVSTTRPETMLGDTAVAVHPDDERYKKLHGKFVKHPFVDRLIPVITDAELVDPEFGTGVVKVTPAHDPNDFATGKRHGLEEINILELDGTLNEESGEFKGLDRFKARKQVKARLEELGLARGEQAHQMTLPRCQRCNTVVEPIISTQWFVKMETLAKPALEKVEDGTIEIVPEDWTKTYYHWLRNIQDWCISRQLWWGHPIPAWYCDDCDHITVARQTPSECGGCKGKKLTQDEDVLDTWFSSALWPFSTLGWPEKTPDLKRFYPTQDMETGYDILFFWVARMIMMGLHFMGEVPFKRVLLAGMVTDENGDKMSKTKGNVVDPLDVIGGATLDELVAKAEAAGAGPKGVKYLKKTYPDGFAAYGADALRMTLLSYSPQTRRIALSIKRIEGYRNFANKLWNASRFVLMNLPEDHAPVPSPAGSVDAQPKHRVNRWIRSRLDRALVKARVGVEEYRLDDASGALYHFVWDELCDWYLELTKPLLRSDDPALVKETTDTLMDVLEVTLRALHPMMPFITEEIWQQLPKISEAPRSIMLADYPVPSRDADEGAEREIETLKGVIAALRSFRAEHQLSRKVELKGELRSASAEKRALLTEERTLIFTLSNAALEVHDESESLPEQAAVSVIDEVRLILPLEGLVDPQKEQERITRELGKVEKDLMVVQKKLGNESFMSRAPEDVVVQERNRETTLLDAQAKLTKALAKFA